MTSGESVQAPQPAAWEDELARTGRVEFGYRWRSALYPGAVVIILGVGAVSGLRGDQVDKVISALVLVLLVVGGVRALVTTVLRPGPPLVVDAQGVHLRKPRQRDVGWETIRGADVVRSLQGATVELVVVGPEGTTSKVGLGRMVGRDPAALAAWLTARAGVR